MKVKELLDLTGRVAIVTGGGRGIGLDLSREEREFHQLSRGLVLLFHS